LSIANRIFIKRKVDHLKTKQKKRREKNYQYLNMLNVRTCRLCRKTRRHCDRLSICCNRIRIKEI